MRVSIDFETRSVVDLLIQPGRDDLAGTYNYASDPSTDIICMAYSINGEEPELWLPGQPIPTCFYDADLTVIAWNADFERCIWDIMIEYGAPALRLEQWYCSAYASRCNNMPAALGNAARCLNVEQQKSSRGRELIKLLCIPLADGSFCMDPALLQEMYDYCLQDVRTEMSTMAQLREPTPEEWRDYHVNCLINDRGVRIDVPLCEAAQVYAAEEEAELLAVIEDITEGQVTKARGENLKAWVMERLTPEQEALCVKYRKGERMLSLDKYNRGRLLALDDLDPDVAEVVECSDFAQKSSVGKFAAMARLADPDDNRARGALMCNGASQSGRYSSKGMQLHNFPRDCMDDPMEVRADMIDCIMAEDMVDYFDKPIMTILSHMLRPALIPAKGHQFLVSDWSAIEGRVAPWLCDTELGNKKLALYAAGEPVYEITAAATFRMKVEDVKNPSRERQVGKVQELAFQFQGGANAFLAMARGYGLKATRSEAERYKDAWRRINPWAVHIWADIERAARLAVKNIGQMYDAGRLSYFAAEDVLAGGTTLFCQLPCGRLLTYPDVRLELKETPWGDVQPTLTTLRAAFVPKAGEKQWPRSSIYGGLLFENAVQGTAASLLRYALGAAEARGLATVLHCHDEIVVESRREADSETLHDVMNTPPAWADGLPLHATVDAMMRYGK
jgi:DNA polymerase bacteriophage-type